MNSEVIITGGAGFIGANLVKALLIKGFKIHVFDNLSTGNIKNLPLDKFYAAKAILHSISIKKDNEPIYGSHFSEYEFIGNFVLRTSTKSKPTQKTLKFFRNYLDGNLDVIQKSILYLFDYKHITYENTNYFKKKQSYRKILKNLFLDIKYPIFNVLEKLFIKI